MQPERSSFSSKEQAILSEIDADGDGQVSEDELRAYLERHQGVVPPGAAKVRVHGLVLQTPGQDPKPYEGVCGNYVRAEDVCNGRAIYMKETAQGILMWWANVNGQMSWCVGPRSDTAQSTSSTLWASVACLGPSPEFAGARPWRVYSYERQEWEMQDGIEVVTLDEQPLVDGSDEQGLEHMNLDSHKDAGADAPIAAIASAGSPSVVCACPGASKMLPASMVTWAPPHTTCRSQRVRLLGACLADGAPNAALNGVFAMSPRLSHGHNVFVQESSAGPERHPLQKAKKQASGQYQDCRGRTIMALWWCQEESLKRVLACPGHKKVNGSFLPGWVVGLEANAGTDYGCMFLPQPWAVRPELTAPRAGLFGMVQRWQLVLDGRWRPQVMMFMTIFVTILPQPVLGNDDIRILAVEGDEGEVGEEQESECGFGGDGQSCAESWVAECVKTARPSKSRALHLLLSLPFRANAAALQVFAKLARFSDRVSLCRSSASLTLSHQELEAQRSTHAPVQTWSPQQVGDWLREIGLGQHSATFEQNAIGGPELLSINPETLDKTLRVARPLHRKKIMTRLSLIVGDAPADPVK